MAPWCLQAELTLPRLVQLVGDPLLTPGVLPLSAQLLAAALTQGGAQAVERAGQLLLAAMQGLLDDRWAA
jgi:hypothetical protein